jgi:hypothetical protein
MVVSSKYINKLKYLGSFMNGAVTGVTPRNMLTFSFLKVGVFILNSYSYTKNTPNGILASYKKSAALQ